MVAQLNLGKGEAVVQFLGGEQKKFLTAVCSERTEGHECMASRNKKGVRPALHEKMLCPEVD